MGLRVDESVRVFLLCCSGLSARTGYEQFVVNRFDVKISGEDKAAN